MRRAHCQNEAHGVREEARGNGLRAAAYGSPSKAAPYGGVHAALHRKHHSGLPEAPHSPWWLRTSPVLSHKQPEPLMCTPCLCRLFYRRCKLSPWNAWREKCASFHKPLEYTHRRCRDVCLCDAFGSMALDSGGKNANSTPFKADSALVRCKGVEGTMPPVQQNALPPPLGVAIFNVWTFELIIKHKLTTKETQPKWNSITART